jgi:CheY-like chemotaxis protein
VYSRAQVQQLRSVMADMAAGSSAADAHRSLAARLLAMDTEAPAPAPEAAGRPGVLVVEREQYSAQLIEYCLRQEGFEVQIALDLLEARRRFLATHADLVIVALLMAGGEQFCRWLKDEGAGAVLGVSALDAPDRAISAGADAFLCKPFSPPQLTAVVDGLIGVIANAEVRG